MIEVAEVTKPPRNKTGKVDQGILQASESGCSEEDTSHLNGTDPGNRVGRSFRDEDSLVV